MQLDQYTLENVNYNDNIRFRMDLEYRSLTEKCFVNVNSTKLYVTYGVVWE